MHSFLYDRCSVHAYTDIHTHLLVNVSAYVNRRVLTKMNIVYPFISTVYILEQDGALASGFAAVATTAVSDVNAIAVIGGRFDDPTLIPPAFTSPGRSRDTATRHTHTYTHINMYVDICIYTYI